MDRARCERCGVIVSPQEIITLDRGSISPAEHICRDCHNQSIAQRMGVNYTPLHKKELTVLDAHEVEHRFILTQLIHSSGLGIIAEEVTEHDTLGYRFSVQGDFREKQADLLNRLADKIKKNISIQYIGSRKFVGRSVSNINSFTVAGRVESTLAADSNGLPLLIIDGKPCTWSELGYLIAKFEGFQFKLDFIDMTDDLLS